MFMMVRELSVERVIEGEVEVSGPRCPAAWEKGTQIGYIRMALILLQFLLINSSRRLIENESVHGGAHFLRSGNIHCIIGLERLVQKGLRAQHGFRRSGWGGEVTAHPPLLR